MKMTSINNKRFVTRGIALAIPLTLAGLAVAQEDPDPPAPMDYTTSITQFKNDLSTTLSTNGPILMGALVVALGFGIVWKLIKRAAKSV